jgi:hypothetical protein
MYREQEQIAGADNTDREQKQMTGAGNRRGKRIRGTKL